MGDDTGEGSGHREGTLLARLILIAFSTLLFIYPRASGGRGKARGQLVIYVLQYVAVCTGTCFQNVFIMVCMDNHHPIVLLPSSQPRYLGMSQ